VQKNLNRQVVLIYGSRNAPDHAFKSQLREISQSRSNIHVINVYSDPLETDQQGIDYHQTGFVSVDLLKELLPNNQCQFYMCGPPPFMEAMYNGLNQWQVPDSRIFYEAFGPASIGKKTKQQAKSATASDAAADADIVKVRFADSNREFDWDPQCESLLELAEENDIVIESGCRAGSCGTCETALLKGKVRYPDGQQVDCAPGHCLACIAQPDGPVELDA